VCKDNSAPPASRFFSLGLGAEVSVGTVASALPLEVVQKVRGATPRTGLPRSQVSWGISIV
jgi:hypothetical protein